MVNKKRTGDVVVQYSISDSINGSGITDYILANIKLYRPAYKPDLVVKNNRFVLGNIMFKDLVNNHATNANNPRWPPIIQKVPKTFF